VITPFSEWPKWLQVLVIVPHGLLGFIATWFWWPKSKKGWNRFGIVAVYLLMFYLVMRFVFHAR
jgi:phosphoglycerol transferase MdoB-like AlkP superfamily enzyme